MANAGGPYSGAQGATIFFNASASTSPSAITAYEWDLDGDGAFDDATDVNPTSSFATIRNTTIGLRVTNASGEEDVAYARLEVTPGSGGVILNGFSPFRVGSQFIGEATARLGETQAFSVTAPNANHYIWELDHLFTVASGVPTYSLTPTADQIGPHVLKVFVTAGTNASLSIKWDVAVLAPDGDGDLWNANADCDDTDAAVHPLGNEITGNGKDDDCDAATPDGADDAAEWEIAPPTQVTIGRNASLSFDVIARDSDGPDMSFGTTTAGCDNPADKFGPNFFFDTEFFPSQGNVLDEGPPRRESTTLTIHTKPLAALGTYCLKLLLSQDPDTGRRAHSLDRGHRRASGRCARLVCDRRGRHAEPAGAGRLSSSTTRIPRMSRWPPSSWRHPPTAT